MEYVDEMGCPEVRMQSVSLLDDCEVVLDEGTQHWVQVRIGQRLGRNGRSGYAGGGICRLCGVP